MDTSWDDLTITQVCLLKLPLHPWSIQSEVKVNNSSTCFFRDSARVSLRAWIKGGPVIGISVAHPCNAHSRWSGSALSRGPNQGTYRCPFQTRLSDPVIIRQNFCPKAKIRLVNLLHTSDFFSLVAVQLTQTLRPLLNCATGRILKGSSAGFAYVQATCLGHSDYQPLVFRYWIAH